MKNGTIIVEGNIVEVGFEMKAGKVHLYGTYEGLSKYLRGGQIYHKGKLIFDK